MNVIDEARKWIDTPFHHQGRVIGVGIDCGGLVVEVAKALGFHQSDMTGYSRIPHGGTLQNHLEGYLDKISALEDGCVLLMVFDTDPQHLAIYNATEDTIIHAYYGARKCCEHRLDSVWRGRIRGMYRFRAA